MGKKLGVGAITLLWVVVLVWGMMTLMAPLVSFDPGDASAGKAPGFSGKGFVTGVDGKNGMVSIGVHVYYVTADSEIFVDIGEQRIRLDRLPGSIAPAAAEYWVGENGKIVAIWFQPNSGLTLGH